MTYILLKSPILDDLTKSPASQMHKIEKSRIDYNMHCDWTRLTPVQKHSTHSHLLLISFIAAIIANIVWNKRTKTQLLSSFLLQQSSQTDARSDEADPFKGSCPHRPMHSDPLTLDQVNNKHIARSWSQFFSAHHLCNVAIGGFQWLMLLTETPVAS